MRDESLRWGLGMGAVAAILGTIALILGAFVEPVNRVTTAETAALAIFIRGIFYLVTLGVALGLAYYAGLRAERARLVEDAAREPNPSATDDQNKRSVAMLAGGLTMFCYWLITSLYLLVLPPSTQPSTAKVDLLSFVENRVIFGIVCVIFGLGMGGLGGRAPAARLLLDKIMKSPLPAPAPVVVAPDVTPATEPPSAQISVAATEESMPSVRDEENNRATSEREAAAADARSTAPVDAGGASNESD